MANNSDSPNAETPQSGVMDAVERFAWEGLKACLAFLGLWLVLGVFMFVVHTVAWMLGGTPRPPWEVIPDVLGF